MKRNQRTLFNRITKAIEKGRKKGLLPTTRSIYQVYDREGEEVIKYACAYGALAAGLDIDIVPPHEDADDDYIDNIITQVNERLGIGGDCGTLLYPTIYVANDHGGKAAVDRDAYAIKILKDELESNPEFCVD